MHRSTAGRIAVDQNIATRDVAVIVEVMQSDPIGNSLGRLFVVSHFRIDQRKGNLNPLTFDVRCPVEGLLCRQPFITSRAAFDDLQPTAGT